jgi:DNA-binding beta-propeller fold protein YncE
VWGKPSSLIAAADSVLVTDEHDGTVLRIDARSGKRVGLPIRIAAPTNDAPAPSATPAGESVWVSSYASNTLDRIDPSTGPDEGGDKVTVRMTHTNDRQQGDEVIDGSLAGTGQFEASGAISGKARSPPSTDVR